MATASHRFCIRLICLAASVFYAGTADARRSRETKWDDVAQGRAAGPPILAVVAIKEQRITIYDADGPLPVNPSGGSIGMGHTLEMSGLLRVVELVLQLRGEAGKHQVNGVHTGVAQCWRGIPTASGAVVVLEK